MVFYKDFQPWEKPQLYVQNYDFFYITNQVLTNHLLFLSLFQVDEQMVTVYNSQTKVICPISLLVKAYGEWYMLTCRYRISPLALHSTSHEWVQQTQRNAIQIYMYMYWCIILFILLLWRTFQTKHQTNHPDQM